MPDIFTEHQSMIVGVTAAFLVSLLLTGILIPKILLIAYRKNFFDLPDERKIHASAIPRLGGIVFVPALIFSVCLVCGIFNLPQYTSIDETGVSSDNVRSVCFSICGLLLLNMVGIADDLIGVLYRAKFVIQIISAVLLICGGLYIGNLGGFCGIYEWPRTCGYLLTLIVTVFFVNAINMIDGIDGLASCLSAVAMAFYGVIFAWGGDILNAIISFAMLGTLMQFFYYNVFGNARLGKKIFMGDTGSLSIGYILTYLSVQICHLPKLQVLDINAVVVAFSPMLVPCLDVLRIFFCRIKAGKNPFLPDKTHIHHKILRLGFSHSSAMIQILFLSATFVIVNVLLSAYLNSALLIVIDLIVWTAYHYRLNTLIARHEAGQSRT